MLQVIISPAKQMRVAADTFTPRGIPPFPERTERLVRELRDIERTQGAEGLKRLWRVNDKLLAENIERLRAKLDQLIADACGKSVEEVSKDTERDHWLYSQEAVDYGLIDRIVHSKAEL